MKQIIFMQIQQAIISKHQNKNDKYVYKILQEDRDTSILCNAMMLVHNHRSIIIYKNYDDVLSAKKLIKNGYVYRKEDII